MTRFDKDKYLRKIKLKRYNKYFYLGIVFLFCLIIGLYFTYSKFSVSKDTEVVKTTVGEFLYGDIIVGAYINGEYSSTFPKKDDGYKVEKIICDNNSTGTWNNDSWGIVVSNLTERTKCNVYFMSDIKVDFDYTGGEQTFTVPVSGIYKLETWGSSGGDSYYSSNGITAKIGGYGAYASGLIHLEKEKKLYINIGESGKATTNMNGATSNCKMASTYNGGGSSFSENCVDSAASGGGATHIALKSGLLNTLENYKSEILIAAGGGGGSYAYTYYGSNGGSAGGITGNLPPDLNGGGLCADRTLSFGSKASQIAYGTASGCELSEEVSASFGQGGSVTYGWGSGGGGGFYGGGIGKTAYGASGGSSYIGNSLLKNKAMHCYNCEESNEENTKTISTTCSEETPTENCAKKGNGYARITLVSNG